MDLPRDLDVLARLDHRRIAALARRHRTAAMMPFHAKVWVVPLAVKLSAWPYPRDAGMLDATLAASKRSRRISRPLLDADRRGGRGWLVDRRAGELRAQRVDQQPGPVGQHLRLAERPEPEAFASALTADSDTRLGRRQPTPPGCSYSD